MIMAYAEAMRITKAFGAALVHARDENMYGTLEAEISNNAAFDLAEKYGWDWEEDDDFMAYASNATPEEILIYGLERALIHANERKQS